MHVFAEHPSNSEASIYDFSVVAMNGKTVPMRSYKGQVLMIVNTASKCGFTPQFEELEALYKAYKDEGFVVLGFPTNQFAKQDPGTNQEIAAFCKLNYGVTFPMFKKIEVNGDGADPLFQFLKAEAPGFLGSERVKWNFTKFLVGRDGKVVKRFAPSTSPKKAKPMIESQLKKSGGYQSVK
ncbi:MAG: glutathione peroxidase [Cellvibrionales bacterium]|nr:glutathione peroxidase [Cellvibrionales bacterium]